MKDHLTLLYKEDLGPVSALRVEGEEREKMHPLSIQAPNPVNIVKSNVTLKIAVTIFFFFWHHPYFFRYGFCLVQASSQQVWVWSYKTFYKRFDRKSENSTLPPLRKTELKWCVLTQTLPHFPRWSPDVQLQKYLKGFVTDSSRK